MNTNHKEILSYGILIAVWALVIVAAYGVVSSTSTPSEKEIDKHKKEMVKPIIVEPRPIVVDPEPEQDKSCEELGECEPSVPSYKRRIFFRWRRK